MRLAAGSGARSLCEHGSSVDLLWTDAAAGLTARPGEGELLQNNSISPAKQAGRQSIFVIEPSASRSTSGISV